MKNRGFDRILFLMMKKLSVRYWGFRSLEKEDNFWGKIFLVYEIKIAQLLLRYLFGICLQM